MKIWSDVFGASMLWAQDCFGSWMHRDDYGDTKRLRKIPGGVVEVNCGWRINTIMPTTLGGRFAWNNYEPMHVENYEFKDDLLRFTIKGDSFEVIKCNLSPGYGYGIVNQSTGRRVDWKAKQNRWYNY